MVAAHRVVMDILCIQLFFVLWLYLLQALFPCSSVIDGFNKKISSNQVYFSFGEIRVYDIIVKNNMLLFMFSFWGAMANFIDSLTLNIKISLLLFYVSPNFIGTATYSKFIA